MYNKQIQARPVTCFFCFFQSPTSRHVSMQRMYFISDCCTYLDRKCARRFCLFAGVVCAVTVLHTTKPYTKVTGFRQLERLYFIVATIAL